MLVESSVLCPYCGSVYKALVDCSAGDQRYIEDCQACCSPINFDLRVGGDGGLAELIVTRDDE